MNKTTNNNKNDDKFTFKDLLLILACGGVVFSVQSFSKKFLQQPENDTQSQQNAKTEVVADSVRNDTIVQHVFHNAKQLKR